MELLTLVEARSLMMALRGQCSTLSKLRIERERRWYSEHPEVASCVQQMNELQDELGEDFYERDLSAREELLFAAMNLLAVELNRLPKCPDRLTPSEDRELRAAMSHAEKLRRRLPPSD